MKKLSVLSMLIPLAMVCSCQKQDATAEQQLAQRKAELDAREKTLDEREKALAEREKVLARAPKLPANVQLPNNAGNPVPAPSIPEGLIPTRDNTSLQSDRDRRIQDRLAQRQERLDALRKKREMRAMSRQGAANAQGPNAQAPTDSDASGGAEATSPSPSPTPQ
ncbi:MAG: hypothetical protein J2P56_06170 [Verrucomicrobia bacterium]|nr:hypothetical protein [Verrucomicrobiota bacterium]